MNVEGLSTFIFSDSEYCEIAQACDFRTSVGLARTESADLKYFLAPPTIPEAFLKENLQNGLRSLLSQLPKVDEKSCISFFTNNALQTELQFFDIHHVCSNPNILDSFCSFTGCALRKLSENIDSWLPFHFTLQSVLTNPGKSQ